MAKTTTTPEAETNEAAEATQKPRGGLLAKIKIGAFVLVVVLVECAVAWMMIPSASEVQAMAESQMGGENEEALDALPEAQREVTLEVDLGEYAVTAYQPDSNTVLRIDFHLFGTVLEEENEEFLQRFDRSQNRMREQVIVTTRNSEITDLTDPNLALLKRRILETTNRTLGKPVLLEVGFTDFSFLEQ